MHHKGLGVGVAVLLASTLSGTPQAQTAPKVVVNALSFTRARPPRPSGQAPRAISKADCLADDVLTFQTRVNVVNRLLLEVWAGTDADCVQATARGVATNSCWLVYQDIPFSAFWPVPIRVQDIVGRRYPSISNGPGVFHSTAEVCDSGMSEPVTLHFMFVDGPAATGETSTWTQTFVDVEPPLPPTAIGVESGESRLLVNWSTAELDVREWRLYCDAVADGASGTGGCSATTSLLVPGQVPPEALRCGTAPHSVEQKGYAEGLTNDVVYAVGVVGVDRVGNVGVLSPLGCDAPATGAENDAEEAIALDSRSCAVGRGARTSSLSDAAAVWLAGAVLLLERRRRARSPDPEGLL